MLILGQPGSGKSTTMLRLVQGKIARAKGNIEASIPVKFNLSTWSGAAPDDSPRAKYIYQGIEKIPYVGRVLVELLRSRWKPIPKEELFVDWLIHQFKLTFDLSEKYIHPLLEKDALIFLLDGLDELNLELRDGCVEAINLFREHNSEVQVAISCRTDDYKNMLIKPELDKLVELIPLDMDQIYGYLENAGADYEGVCAAVLRDDYLQEMASVPLMLSTMMTAFQGVSAEELDFQDLAGGSRKRLFDVYVRRIFARRGSEISYKFDQTLYWLGWLAHRLRFYSQTQFSLDQIPENWLLSPLLIGTYYLSVTLMHWMTLGILLGLMCGLGIGLSSNLLLWSLLGLGLGLGCGILHWFFLVPPFVLVDSVINLRLAGISVQSPTDPTPSHEQARHLDSGNLGQMYEERSSGAELRQVVGITFLLFLALYGLAWHFFYQNRFGMDALILFFIGLLLFLMTAIRFAAEAGLINYLILRVFLYRNGFTPWNYKKFLDFAVDRVYLIKTGQVYKFRHDFLLNYFADTYISRLNNSK